MADRGRGAWWPGDRGGRDEGRLDRGDAPCHGPLVGRCRAVRRAAPLRPRRHPPGDARHDIAIHEAHAIDVVAPLGLPTPELLACDPHGHTTDRPALVLSWLEGLPAWETLTRHQLDAMVEALLVLHSARDEARAGLRALERYEQTVYASPRWTARPALWERAFEIFHSPIPTGDLALVHRDFHPGNLLWTRRRLSGIVDWQSACVGPASIDVGHCRLNMFHYSADQADQLRSAWERASGHAYDPWADVVSIIGILDTFRTHRRASASLVRIENALADAVASLTG